MYNQYTLHVTKRYSQAIQVLKGTRHVKQCQECVGEDEKLYKIVKIYKIYFKQYSHGFFNTTISP